MRYIKVEGNIAAAANPQMKVIKSKPQDVVCPQTQTQIFAVVAFCQCASKKRDLL